MKPTPVFVKWNFWAVSSVAQNQAQEHMERFRIRVAVENAAFTRYWN